MPKTVSCQAGPERLEEPQAGGSEAIASGRRADLDPSLFQRFLPEIAHRTSGEILTHPDFGSMRRRYMASTMACYEVASFPGGWPSVAYRVAAICAIVCLHAASDPADRATWPTLARFKGAVATFALSSPRQIDDLVARLVETGHILLERSAADGRLRLLRPTDKLLAWDRAVMSSYYAVLQGLYPAPGYGPAVACDPAFHLAQRRVSLAMFGVVARFMAENRDLLPFHGMNQGVHALMQVELLREADARASLRESDVSGIMTRFGVSRSHVRNILMAAEAAGLLTGSGQGRRDLDLTSRGRAALDRFIANSLASHDMCYRMALTSLGVDPGRPPGARA